MPPLEHPQRDPVRQRYFFGTTLRHALAAAHAECGKDALLLRTLPGPRGYVVIVRPAAAPPSTQQTEEPTVEIPRLPRATGPEAALLRQGRAFGMSTALLDALRTALGPGDDVDHAAATAALSHLLPTCKLALPQFHTTVLVGPSGAGKSATATKLAVAAAAAGERAVLLRLDPTARAAWREHAATASAHYAVATVADIEGALRLRRAHEDVQRWIVDTEALRPRRPTAVSAMARQLEPLRPATVVCLPATHRPADAAAVLTAATPLAPAAAVVTKWDETSQPGEILSLLAEAELPLSHVAVGPDPHTDLVHADARVLAECVLRRPAEAPA